MIWKQVTFNVPLSAWLELRAAAARLDIPIAELCRRLMDAGRPHVEIPEHRETDAEVCA